MTYIEAKKLYDDNIYKVQDCFLINGISYKIDEVLICRTHDWRHVYDEIQSDYTNEIALKTLGLIDSDHLDVILISNIAGKPTTKPLTEYLKDTNQIA